MREGARGGGGRHPRRCPREESDQQERPTWWAMPRCHCALPFSMPTGVLHINDNGGGEKLHDGPLVASLSGGDPGAGHRRRSMTHLRRKRPDAAAKAVQNKQKALARRAYERCEDCQLKQPTCGLPSERRRRWCFGCSKAHTGAVGQRSLSAPGASDEVRNLGLASRSGMRPYIEALEKPLTLYKRRRRRR